ncbi:MAG: AAA family ATPase [Desulfobacteraceae bacterium]|nr:AAA family ATPase [Desulfobacteraceae bacterium]
MPTPKPDLSKISRFIVPKQSKDLQPHRSILLTGEGGSGKTHFALQAPGPIACVYLESNRVTVEKAHAQRDDITEYAIESWNDFYKDFLPFVKNRLLVDEHGKDVATIVLDSVDVLCALNVDRLTDLGDSKGQKKMSSPAWGVHLKNCCEAFRVLGNSTKPTLDHAGYNFIATCHIARREDGEGIMSREYQPSIQGSFRTKLSDLFDHKFYMEKEVRVEKDTGKKSDHYHCWTRADFRHPTKSDPGWPDEFESFAEFEECVKEDLGG